MFNFIDILDDKPPLITIIDIGAQHIGDEALSYQSLIKQGLCRVIGFEPVQQECEKLNSMHPDFTYLPYFIGDGTFQDFHLTNAPVTASLYEPNHALLKRFVNLDELCQVVEVEEVATVRLDDVREIDCSPDFIKCDVQGAELQVFENAERLLQDTVLVESEVEFVQLYKDQPLFGDIDACLRGQGFQFHKLLGLCGRPYAPLSIKGDPNRPISQHLWSDAVYVSDPATFDALPIEKLLTLAILLHEIYQSVDLCCAVLQVYDRRSGTELSGKYLTKLNSTG